MDYLELTKLYNEVVDRTGIYPDKYEREDGFFGIYEDLQNGTELMDAFINVFDVVHGYPLTEKIFKSCVANVKGWDNE